LKIYIYTISKNSLKLSKIGSQIFNISKILDNLKSRLRSDILRAFLEKIVNKYQIFQKRYDSISYFNYIKHS
jgi:hypothetical protein